MAFNSTAAAIMTTVLVFEPVPFVKLQTTIGDVQVGISPNLLGGKSRRKGTDIDFLNSVRFLGMAFGRARYSAIEIPTFTRYVYGYGRNINRDYVIHLRNSQKEERRPL